MAEGKGILKSLQEKIFQLNKQHFLIGQNDKILVGFSGGPDSVFLLHFLLRFKKRYNLQIYAVHVNHMLRGTEADSDERFCVEFCQKNAIPLTVEKKNAAAFAKKNNLSVEEAGRMLRYEIFRRVMKAYGCNKIATAHTMDDNLESLLLNVIKGTGTDGLRAIAPVYDGCVIRPLLMIEKAGILKFLADESIDYRYDSSNSDTDFQRNFLRLEIIPRIKEKINPRFAEAAFRLSQNARELENYISTCAVELKAGILKKVNNGMLIDADALKALDSFMQGRVILSILNDDRMNHCSFSDVQSVMKLINSQKGRSCQLRNGYRLIRESGCIIIKQQEGTDEKLYECVIAGRPVYYNSKMFLLRKVKPSAVKVAAGRDSEYIDAGMIKGRLLLRNWKPGDAFYPLGLSRRKKLSDFLTDEKMTRAQKDSQLVLCDEVNIIWVAGRRLDERYKITAATTDFINITFK